VFRRSASVLLLQLLCALLGRHHASAQPTLAQATPEQQEHARNEYQRGLQAFEAQQYDAALEAFAASYTSVASPNTGLMVGRSNLALQRPAAAYRAFADVIDMAEAWGNERYAESASAAREEMAALKPVIVMLMLDVEDDGAGARLTIGELEVPRRYWHRPYASEPGTIVVTLAGSAGEQRRELSLGPGVAASIELRLAAASEPGSAVPPGEVEPAPPAPPSTASAPHVERDSANTGLRVASYVTAGAGVAAVVGFAVLGSMAGSRFDALQRGCPDRTECDPTLRAEAEQGDRLQTAANVALVAGCALIATGTTLFVLSLDQADEAQLAVTGSGVTLRGAL
jgi:hypothetical protein